MKDLLCANCRKPIAEGVHPYTMRIEIFPRVEESLEFQPEDLEGDFDEEIQQIVEQLEAMSETEAQLEEERVYSCFTFVLCPSCRDFLASQFRSSSSPE
jgi:hypothetical protein